MLARMPKNEGTKGQLVSRGVIGGNTMLPPIKNDAPTLADLGIEKTQSSRWQQIASLTDEVFEEHITDTKSDGKELT